MAVVFLHSLKQGQDENPAPVSVPVQKMYERQTYLETIIKDSRYK